MSQTVEQAPAIPLSAPFFAGHNNLTVGELDSIALDGMPTHATVYKRGTAARLGKCAGFTPSRQ